MNKLIGQDGREIDLVDDDSVNYLRLDTSGAIMVEGIEDWIESLVPVQDVNPENEYNAIRMIDPKTRVLFAVAKLKETE